MNAMASLHNTTPEPSALYDSSIGISTAIFMHGGLDKELKASNC
jgi:hypothetical protein